MSPLLTTPLILLAVVTSTWLLVCYGPGPASLPLVLAPVLVLFEDA